MQDIELYRQLLGLNTPWTVTRVELRIKEQRVEVWAGHAESARWPCPECATELALYDHGEERTWRHLDSCQFQTYLHARPPRVACLEHGVRQVRLPWAEPRARFTTLFERLAIDVLRETDVKGATRILGISWDEAWEIKRRAVARGRARRRPQAPARLGVDETAIARGHDYLTLVSDLTTGTVEYLAEERKQASLDGYFTSLTPAQRAQIQAVAMDMWEPYVQSVQTHVPQAERKIVFDVFHILQHMNTAVDKVRRAEHRLLRAQGDDTLTGSKYVWLYGEENVPDHHQERFTELTRRRSRKPLKTARAWSLKESLRDLWPGRGRGAVALLVRVGDARPAAAGPRGGADDQAASAQRADLLPASHHQRHERGHRQQDPGPQEDGQRVPQSRQLQDGDLLPLRWPRSLPRYDPLNSRMRPIL